MSIKRRDDATRKTLSAEKAVRRRKRKKEKLSQYDIEQLMGIRRDTYRRDKGRVKRK